MGLRPCLESRGCYFRRPCAYTRALNRKPYALKLRSLQPVTHGPLAPSSNSAELPKPAIPQTLNPEPPGHAAAERCSPFCHRRLKQGCCRCWSCRGQFRIDDDYKEFRNMPPQLLGSHGRVEVSGPIVQYIRDCSEVQGSSLNAWQRRFSA